MMWRRPGREAEGLAAHPCYIRYFRYKPGWPQRPGRLVGPNPLRESPKAHAALGMLERAGWLEQLGPGTVVRGKARKMAWRIVRGLADVV